MKEAASSASLHRDDAHARNTILGGDVEDLETERDIAAFLKLTRGALQRQRQCGVGPPYIKLPTGVVRYRKSEVLAWVRLHRVDPSRA